MPSCFVGGVEQSVSKPDGESSGDTHRVPQQSLKTVVVPRARCWARIQQDLFHCCDVTVSPKFVTVSGFELQEKQLGGKRADKSLNDGAASSPLAEAGQSRPARLPPRARNARAA